MDSVIGYGAPTKAGSHAAHGEPLGVEEIRGTKRNYGWPEDEQFLRHDPVALVLSRQAMPTLDRTTYASADGVANGAYVLAGDPDTTPDVILIGTGTELSLAVSAYEQLTADGVNARVVSMPSWELFDRQDQAHRDQVLPPSVTARVAVEQASSFGWYRWVGPTGAIIGMSTFGASGPLKALQTKFGFTPESILAAAHHQIHG